MPESLDFPSDFALHVGSLAAAVLSGSLFAFGVATLSPADAATAAAGVVVVLALGLAPERLFAGARGYFAGWCLATALLALVDAALLGRHLVAPARLAAVALLTAAIVFATHGAVLLAVRRVGRDAEVLRTCVLAALVLAGSMPLILGPVALLVPGAARLPDRLLLVSPLVHLAVAAGGDLMRNPWFYAHTSLGSLRFDYPSPLALATGYASICAAIALSLAKSRQESRS